MNNLSSLLPRRVRSHLQKAMVWMALVFAGAAQAQVAAPSLTPQASSAYPVTQDISVSCATSGAVIHYTTNGNDPTATDKVVVSGQTVTVNRPMTLKAKAFHATLGQSAVTSSYYGVFGQVAAGSQHTLALTTDGTVWAWGYNSNGQLGDGTTTQRTIPGLIPGLTNVIAIAAGDSHSVALKSDGTVWCWGNNGQGRLGDGTTVTRKTPVQVSGLSGIAEIAAGSNYTVALKNDGTVWAWGANGQGQLGDNTVSNKQTPVQVSGLTNAIEITAGREHTLALKSDGTVVAWGYNSKGQLGNNTLVKSKVPVAVSGLTGVAHVEAGDLHSVALKTDGTVWCWGFNSKGQLGDNTTTDRLVPVQASGLTGALVVSAGDNHTLAVTGSGAVWAWGANDYGQLGIGNTTYKTTPQQVTGLSGMVTLSGGGTHSVAIKVDGTVWSWGRNNKGQLCDASTTDRLAPVQVRGYVQGGQVAQVASSGQHSLALSDGTVWAWGYNSNGQLGDGTTTQRTVPTQIAELTNIIAVGAGDIHSVALKSDGTVWTWGGNTQGRLGDGTTTDRHTPVQVNGLTGVVEIAVGGDFNLARKNDGTVWAWGNNAYGKLGDNTTTNRYTPVQVSGLTTAVGLGAGSDHSLAIKSDGTVVTWGLNSKGQLGNNTLTNSKVPVAVSSLTGVTHVEGGFKHSVAVKDDGTVWCWGYNLTGQLGNNTNTDQKVPVQVSGLSGVVAVAAGEDHTIAVTDSGNLWTWGGNTYGQLGIGNTTNKTTPQQVTTVSGILAASGGANHTLALKNDGSIWASGRNIKGQLGDGSTTDRTSPVQVQGPPVPPATGWLYLIDALLDSDGDGLPNWWELQNGLDPNDNGSVNVNNGPLGDPDGDGANNLAEYTNGTDPLNFFNGVLPELSIVSGNNQTGDIGTILAQPLVISLTNPGVGPFVNAPVLFSVTQGEAQLAASENDTPSASLNLHTDAGGQSSVVVLLPAQVSDSQITVSVTSGAYTTSVTFTVTAQEPVAPGGYTHWTGINFSRGSNANEADPENHGVMAASSVDGFIPQMHWNNLNISDPLAPFYLAPTVDADGNPVTAPQVSFTGIDWIMPTVDVYPKHGMLFPDQTPTTPNTLGYIGMGDFYDGNQMSMTVTNIPYRVYDIAVLEGWFENGLRWHVFKSDDPETWSGQDGWVGNTFTGEFSTNYWSGDEFTGLASGSTFTFHGNDGHAVYAVQILGRDPVNPGSGTPPSNVKIGDLPLGSFNAQAGTWAQLPDGTLRSFTRRGPVDFTFDAASAGYYVIELKASAFPADPYTPHIPVIARVDGAEVGRGDVLPYFSDHLWLTQRLSAGTHTLTIDNRNLRTGVSLSIASITIYRSQGADTNSNGTPDWLESRFNAEGHLDAGFTDSLTSPFCIEGAERLAGDARVFVGQTAVPTSAGLAGRWFANVPLNSTGDTVITTTFENGSLSQQHTLHWTTTNIFTPPAATIRVRLGDSLKVIAVPDGLDGQQTTSSVTLNGTAVGSAGPALVPRVVTFNNAGTFTLAASAVTGGDTQQASVQIEVVEADFGPAFSLVTASLSTRIWDLPGISHSVDLQYDTGLTLEEIERDPSLSRRFNARYTGITAAAPRVLARLQNGGPNGGSIAAAATVNAFRLALTDATGDYEIIQTLPDGTRLIAIKYVMDGPIPADLSVRLEMFVEGAVFINGDTSMELTAASFNALGETEISFYAVPGANIPRICHNIYPHWGCSIGDRVWRDDNANGIQDTGELGLPDVTVELLDPNGTFIRSTVTDAGGNYRFDHLPPGNYRLHFPVQGPGNRVLTLGNQGSSDAKDSDADPGTGVTDVISLTGQTRDNDGTWVGGVSDMTWDAGYVPQQ